MPVESKAALESSVKGADKIGGGVSRLEAVAGLSACILIAFAPVLFALSTWDVTNAPHALRAWLRNYGVPVLAIEVVVIGFAYASGFEPVRTLRAAPRWAMAALATVLAISVYTTFFVAADPLVAATRTLMWIIHLMFGLGVAHLAARNLLNEDYFWPIVVVGLCGYAAVLAAFAAAIPRPELFSWVHLRLGVGNVRQLGFYSAIGAAAALGIACNAKRDRSFLASAMAAAVLLAISFWSGTRGSLIAVWIAFFPALIWFPALRNIKTAITVIVTTAAGLGLSLLHSVPDPHYGLARIGASAARATLNDMTSGGVEDVTSGRISMWTGTLQAIFERPMFGYGEGQFRLMVAASQGGYNHPHNAFLQVLVTWGFVGGLCFVALAGLISWKCRLALSQRRSPAQLPAFLVLASLLTMSLYEGSLYHAYPIMMIAVSAGYIIGKRTAA